MRPVASPVSSPVGSPVSLHPKIGKFSPSKLPDLQMWCRHASGITIAGQGVSQWDDQSGNGNHLLQATDANRPLPGTAGSELVTNGTFATDTDWTKGTGWTISAGVASKAAGASANLTSDDAYTTYTEGKKYIVTFTISGYVSGTVAAWVRGNTGTHRGANGTYSEIITAGSNTSEGFILATVLGEFSVDDVTVKELDYSDGILFDGTDDYLRATFTLNQPFTYYLVGQQVSYLNSRHIVNGVTANVALSNSTSTPTVRLYAGTAQVADNTDWTVGANAVVAVAFDGASSLIQVNNGTATTGNPGTGDPGGFTLGTNNSAASASNIQVKEIVLCNTLHDAATRTRVFGYAQGLL